MVSHDLGGLDVGSLWGKNLSLLGKWRWRFLMEKDAMWRKVICNLHGNDVGFSSVVGPRLNKGVWLNIIRAGTAIDNLGILFSNSFIRKVKSGSDTFLLIVNGEVAGLGDALLSTINGLSLSLGDHDKWKWSLNANGTFSVNILSKMIDKQQFSSRIPHLSNFDKRDIDVHSLLCLLCENEVEDINHIMFDCPKVKTLWSKCYDRWDILYPVINNVHNIGNDATFQGRKKGVAKMFHCILNRCKLIDFDWSRWVNNPKAVADAITSPHSLRTCMNLLL
ncbi:RNA-directed DNA polymerase, eukaryota, reverse transcriptase zinc-binding domain protein [Tanacetum coccineum]